MDITACKCLLPRHSTAFRSLLQNILHLSRTSTVGQPIHLTQLVYNSQSTCSDGIKQVRGSCQWQHPSINKICGSAAAPAACGEHTAPPHAAKPCLFINLGTAGCLGFKNKLPLTWSRVVRRFRTAFHWLMGVLRRHSPGSGFRVQAWAGKGRRQGEAPPRGGAPRRAARAGSGAGAGRARRRAARRRACPRRCTPRACS